MTADWTDTWKLRGELYAFFGNSLLRVMTEQSALTLDPAFWESFPLEPTNEHLASGLEGLIACTHALAALDRDKAIERVGVEYTRLFIGPGAPAAPPWETLYREGGTVLFGKPTFDMKRLFAERGLKASADSHQFEDHLGFELLYLGMVGACFVEREPSVEMVARQQDFIREHPLSFVGALWEKARATVAVAPEPAPTTVPESAPAPAAAPATRTPEPPAPEPPPSPAKPALPGYYPALIELIWGFLLWDLELLSEYSEVNT